MGLNSNSTKLLLYAKKAGIDFRKTLMLGRQHFFATAAEAKAQALNFGLEKDKIDQFCLTDSFSEPFFRLLGSDIVDSMDFSGYEQATIVFDLNNPIPANLLQQYTVVFDGGTLEHVFNFPQAIKNAMNMVQVGGHFISITPANNLMGHGFYQFSPELFFRIFSAENGFELVDLFVNTNTPEGQYGNWYGVRDPQEVHERVLLTNALETSMMVIARRVAVKDIFAITPQQSDYAATWEHTGNEKSEGMQAQAPPVKSFYQKLLPAAWRAKIWQYRYKLQHTTTFAKDLGHYNPRHFTKTGY